MVDEGNPEGGVVGKGLLLTFDVDCGEVVPGRHLHLRSLRDEGRWPDRLGNRLPDHVHGSWQMVSLQWELVPAVREDDPDAAKWYQHDVADVEYRVDPALGWDLRTASGVGGGTADATPGQPNSHGTYGPYPLPADARQVSFTVFPYRDRRPGDDRDRIPNSYVIEGSQHAAGKVVIDLTSGAARWESTGLERRE